MFQFLNISQTLTYLNKLLHHGLEAVLQYRLLDLSLGCLEYTDLSDGVLCEPDYKEATRGLATRNTTTQKKASSRLLISHYAHLFGERANQC